MRFVVGVLSASAFATVLHGCSDDASPSTKASGSTGVEDGGNDGSGSGSSGSFPLGDASTSDAGSGDGGGCGPNVTGVLRDFKISHPDFEEDTTGADRGIVLPDLGADSKPVYAGQAGHPTTSGKANFDQWYRDVPGVNDKELYELKLVETQPGRFVFDDQDFFPLDGKLFGNEGNAHNYHFTYELHTEFAYTGGETFLFRGDDDLFVFINNKLAIDLGGVHGPEDATIDMDAKAASLGIEKGHTYPLDFFFAERHTTQSTFHVETTLKFVSCGTVK
jgi:fibro-slime domain-containing protein